jgi:hypothetical protein
MLLCGLRAKYLQASIAFPAGAHPQNAVSFLMMLRRDKRWGKFKIQDP